MKDCRGINSHGLKRDLARKLDDPGARAKVELRAQRRLEWRPRGPQADGRGSSAVCTAGGELGGAQRSIVCAVEGVVGFQDELGFDALTDQEVLGESRSQRNEVVKVESVT